MESGLEFRWEDTGQIDVGIEVTRNRNWVGVCESVRGVVTGVGADDNGRGLGCHVAGDERRGTSDGTGEETTRQGGVGG